MGGGGGYKLKSLFLILIFLFRVPCVPTTEVEMSEHPDVVEWKMWMQSHGDMYPETVNSNKVRARPPCTPAHSLLYLLKELFYLTTHSTHFIYGYMVTDIW